NAVPIFRFETHEKIVGGHPGVVDYNINFLVLVNDFFDPGIDLSLVGNIEGRELSGATGLGEFVERLLGRRGVDRIVDDDMSSQPAEVQRDRPADAAARAGN